jgi:glycosyltransferase involved in cell wall biosynthesis
VQPGDTAALADAIEYLVDNPNDREKLGKAARIQAEKHWEREMIIEGFEHQLISLRETGRKTITRKNAT